MKMLPVQLSLNPPLGLWSDVLWRCPPAPPSQLAELKTQLPPSLPSDPRLWGREDVTVFLRFCEREFDLPKVDHDLFQMNGKALCLLTRADFGHRCPGAGDVLHNVLQMLIIESHMMHWHLPNSPVTPTSRYPLSPHSHPSTPTWPPIVPSDNPFHNAPMHHFMPPNSVTLSPPPSVDSQASSPPQNQEHGSGGSGGGSNGSSSSSSNSNSNSSMASNCGNGSITIGISNGGNNCTGGGGGGGGSGGVLVGGNAAYNQNHLATNSSSSNQSDSDEENYIESKVAARNSAAAAVAAAVAVAHYSSAASPPTTPVLKEMPPSISQQIANNFVNSWSQNHQQQQQPPQAQNNQKMHSSPNGSLGGSSSAPTTPSYMPVKREFFPENSEPNTNGRLLWDFLQQLLNDRNQKYSDLIAWKCRDTGVFKIVDPAGLAKLWGIQKNHLSMNYDKMSRALRYYYRVNILRKVQGERHCYQFLRNPTELKNIKNISLLRQSMVAGGSASNVGGNNAQQQQQQQQQQSNSCTAAVAAAATTSSSTNWSISQQSQQQQQQHQQVQVPQSQQSPQHQQQRPSSRSSNSSSSNNNNSSSNNNNNNSNSHLGLPSSSAAAAAAAVAAAAAYGPPPTSPLFMHAINGAFHYLSSTNSATQPPNSPPILPSAANSSEKLQFSGLKSESSSSSGHDSGEEMKPTDLSIGSGIGSTEKRAYTKSPSDDCYPLIRSADGLTTIKLIRYNDNELSVQQQQQQQQKQQQLIANPTSPGRSESHEPYEEMLSSPIENECNDAGGYDSLMPTDLRK